MVVKVSGVYYWLLGLYICASYLQDDKIIRVSEVVTKGRRRMSERGSETIVGL